MGKLQLLHVYFRIYPCVLHGVSMKRLSVTWKAICPAFLLIFPSIFTRVLICIEPSLDAVQDKYKWHWRGCYLKCRLMNETCNVPIHLWCIRSLLEYMTVCHFIKSLCIRLVLHNFLGDFTASTICRLPFWNKIIGNAGAEEPRFITAHYLYHLQPEMKYLVTMRNPVER